MYISRRKFLKTTISGAALLAAGNLDSALCKDDIANDSAKDPKDLLKDLKLHGRIVTPGGPDYIEASEDYNGRFTSHPNFVLYCENENDVVQAIKWVRKEQIPFSLRSGGHSYEGFSIIDGGAVIDVSQMSHITINAAKKQATVQSGAKLMPLYETLWEKRLVVPGGSCATVGVAGLALGGGFGLLARHMGLSCDNVLSLRLVDAGGNIIEADEHNHADLYWACRGGGGGNFGAVTEFTFRTHTIGNVTIFRIKWNWLDMPSVIQTWQKWAPHADERITSVLTLTSKKSNRVSCIGVFVGSPGEVNSLIKPLLHGDAKPLNVSISTSPFIDAARRFSGLPKPGKKAPAKPTPDAVHIHVHPRFKNTSDYVNKELDESAIKTIVTHLTESPRDSSCLQFDSYGGKINQVPTGDTAFCHRGDTKFCLHYQISWAKAAEDERNIKWVNDFRKAMQPHVSGFSYVNYIDRTLENWAHSYYGQNLQRLVAVKHKYDPDNFFNFPQSIPVQL